MSSLNLNLPFSYGISECLNERQKLIKRFKYYSLLLFCLFHIIQCVFIYYKLGYMKLTEIPLYYFGVYHYLGGLPQFYYLLIIFCAFYSVQYLIIFNRNLKLRSNWFKIIEVLNTDSQSIHILGLTDKYFRGKYLKHVTLVSKVVKNISDPYILNCIILIAVFTATHLSINDFMIYGIIALLLASIFFYINLNCTYYGFLNFFIVCYFCEIRLNAFNFKLNQMISDLFISRTQILKTLKEFDIILNEIICFNQFWKSYIFSIYYTIIPILLFSLHSLLFEQETYFLFIMLVIFIITYSSIIMSFNLITSSINKQSIITFKIWQKFYLNNENIIKSDIKLKVKEI